MSAVLQLILSQDYSLPAETEEDDYGNWLEVTGGSENPLRALRITVSWVMHRSTLLYYGWDILSMFGGFTAHVRLYVHQR